jgi:hypothetical protein
MVEVLTCFNSSLEIEDSVFSRSFKFLRKTLFYKQIYVVLVNQFGKPVYLCNNKINIGYNISILSNSQTNISGFS